MPDTKGAKMPPRDEQLADAETYLLGRFHSATKTLGYVEATLIRIAGSACGSDCAKLAREGLASIARHFDQGLPEDECACGHAVVLHGPKDARGNRWGCHGAKRGAGECRCDCVQFQPTGSVQA